MNTSTDLHRVIHALVQTPEGETLYHRAGTGESVLLLVEGGAGSAAGGALFARLAAESRVYAPVATPQAGGQVRCGDTLVPGEAWLASLIDALGVERPAIVADPAFTAIALAFAGSDPERVAGVRLTGAIAAAAGGADR